MSPMKLTRRICCMTLVAVAVPAQAMAGMTLAPHRAFYVLEADKLDNKGGVSAIAGKLAYEITGSDCEGYAVNYRIANRYIQGEGSPQTMDVQLNSFESGDGLELDMKQKQFVNASLESETRVKAKKPRDGGPLTGEMEGKETKTFTVDAAAIFPTAFQKKLMEDAAKGESRSVSLVYEGSDDVKPTRAISFIGIKKQGAHVSSGADAPTMDALNKLPYWPVTVSYYDVAATGDDQPTYAASFNMLENGVSTDLVLDYGSYTLKGKLEKIEMLKAEPCQ
jgi:EipB-like